MKNEHSTELAAKAADRHPVQERKPDSKFWPNGTTLSFLCPWCGANTMTNIVDLREDGLAGRVDDCLTCGKDIIIEAYEEGVCVFQAISE